MTEREIFLAVIDMPDAAARTAYLDEACAGDATLRERVEGLLRSHETAGSFLAVPAVAPPDPECAHTRAFAPTPDPDTEPTGTSEGTPVGEDEPLTFLAPSERPDSLGRIGHYEVLQVLGRGGFGIVLRAFDEVLHRVVAVKVLSPQMAATSPARKRFLREAQSSAAIRHENVVQVYEVGEQPLPYLVMELIPGETLQQRLDRTGPLDIPEVLRIGRQIAEGLAAAHDHELIHRDIKPGNILLESGPRGHAKITDFGLARAADDASISQSGLVAGTPMYMAPEQARGDHVDHRADLFSLGSVLYQMVTGRPPFRANSTLAVLKRVVEDDPRPIRDVIPEVPQWLCDIISKLHVKNRGDRFQSAREVADVLTDCEVQLNVGSKLHDFSRIPRGKSPRTGRWKWALAAAILLPLLAFGVHALTRSGPRAETVDSGNTGRQVPPTNAAPTGLHGWPADAPSPAVAPFESARARQHQEAWAKYLNLPVEYTNSVRMKFVLIPPGEYPRGSDPEELAAALRAAGDDQNWELHVRSEVPRHTVILTQPFYLAVHEVTQSEYGQVAGVNPSYFTPTGEGKARVAGVVTSTLPVEQVSWHDAIDFCARLSRKEGLKPSYVHIDHTTTPIPSTGYRLPTEAEWEFACRAGTTTRYTAGPHDHDLSRSGWHRPNAESRTQLVGKLAANPFGLHDMEGNVWEWVQDWWQPNYYAEFRDKPAIDPPGAPAGTLRGVRGGSWPNPASCCRPGHRFSFAPNRWGFLLGFRLALPIEGVRQALKQPTKAAAAEPPAFPDAEAARIAALPAKEQVDEVRKALQARNPDFDGTLAPTFDGDAVAGLRFSTLRVNDVSPVRTLVRLRRLEIEGPDLSAQGQFSDLSQLRGMQLSDLRVRNNRVTDLSPLKGMPLRLLDLDNNPITDLSVLKALPALTSLSIQNLPIPDLKALEGLKLEELGCIALRTTDLTPLKGMSLRLLSLHATPVSDLKPLSGMPLDRLNLHRTKVSDLSPLKGMHLTELHIRETEVTDLSPLKDVPLKKLFGDFQRDRDFPTLREIRTLELINDQPAAEFLK